MSSESSHAATVRKNFASRLLTKAIQERKTGEIPRPAVPAVAEPPVAAAAAEVKEPAVSA